MSLNDTAHHSQVVLFRYPAPHPPPENRLVYRALVALALHLSSKGVIFNCFRKRTPYSSHSGLVSKRPTKRSERLIQKGCEWHTVMLEAGDTIEGALYSLHGLPAILNEEV